MGLGSVRVRIKTESRFCIWTHLFILCQKEYGIIHCTRQNTVYLDFIVRLRRRSIYDQSSGVVSQTGKYNHNTYKQQKVKKHLLICLVHFEEARFR